MLIIGDGDRYGIALNKKLVIEDNNISNIFTSFFALHYIFDIHYEAEKTMQIVEYFLKLKSPESLLRPKMLIIKCDLQLYAC